MRALTPALALLAVLLCLAAAEPTTKPVLVPQAVLDAVPEEKLPAKDARLWEPTGLKLNDEYKGKQFEVTDTPTTINPSVTIEVNGKPQKSDAVVAGTLTLQTRGRTFGVVWAARMNASSYDAVAELKQNPGQVHIRGTILAVSAMHYADRDGFFLLVNMKNGEVVK